jgi:hypothetical protein
MPGRNEQMSGHVAHYPGTEADFEAIEQAVMETDRGRLFLQEYARRNRNADTQVLLTALSRIEQSITIRQEPTAIDQFRIDILEMTRAIAQTKTEIAAIQPEDGGHGPLLEASGELGLIVSETERATSDILAAAEQVQESAWTLREAGADTTLCDLLDEHATHIYTSCSFQDLTAQRTRKVIDALGFLEQRLNKMAEIWNFTEPQERSGAQTSPAPGGTTAPVASAPIMSQADVDFVLVDDGRFASARAQEPADASAADEMLFSREAALKEASQEPAAGGEGLKVVHNGLPTRDTLVKAQNESALTAAEAERALEALKALPVEDRTLLFS